MNVLLPAAALQESKCSLCDSFLSVPPIMVVFKDRIAYQCGQCKDIKCKVSNRFVLFENIAKFLQFPCSYEGCKEDIPWERVATHENTCEFRTITCRCQKPVAVKDLENHFLQSHLSCVAAEYVSIKLKMTSNAQILLKLANQQFFIYIFNIYSSHIYVTVFSMDDSTSYDKYSIKMTSETSNSSVLFNNKRIIRYDDRQHCYLCFRGRCILNYHPYQNVNAEKKNWNAFTIQIEKDVVLKLLGNPEHIDYEINLIYNEEDKEIYEQAENSEVIHLKDIQRRVLKKEKYSEKNNVILKQDLACPICMEYMTAPIYACQTGHAICEACKQKLSTCPTCKAKIENARNFALEDIAENVKLSCPNYKNGCEFLGNIRTLPTHEQNCYYVDFGLQHLYLEN